MHGDSLRRLIRAGRVGTLAVMAGSTITVEQVETAIKHVLAGGQEYQLPNGVMVKRANLAELRVLADELRSRQSVTALTSGPGGGGTWQPVALSQGRHL